MPWYKALDETLQQTELGGQMKARLNDRGSKSSLLTAIAKSRVREIPEEFADNAALAQAHVEIIRAQEQQKTLRTWAICGTVVAGMAIISYATIQRYRQLLS
jgi:hypothetical protein